MAFAWSYSKIKNFEVCPKKHYEVDIAKSFADTSEALTWGNAVHKAMADACTGTTPLAPEFKDYQKWVDKVLAGPGKLLTEQKFAITKDFQPTKYFANDVWYRGIGDIVRIAGEVALVLDWKTGKVLVDSVQLMLMAQCIFSHFPEVKKVRSEFIWLKEDCATPEVFDRKNIKDEWIGLLPRVAEYKNALDTMTFAPKPGKLCRKWCPVQSCAFHGKGA